MAPASRPRGFPAPRPAPAAGGRAARPEEARRGGGGLQFLLALLGTLTGIAVLFLLYGLPFLYCGRYGLRRGRPGLVWFGLAGWLGVLACALLPPAPPQAQGGDPERR
jgi:hypothetical protein